MVLLLQNDFAGQIVGDNVSTLNSAESGVGFSHVLPSTGTIKYISEGGKIGVEFDQIGGSVPTARWTLVDSQGRVMVTRRSFNYDGVLSAARAMVVHHTSPFGSPSAFIGVVQQRGGQPQVEITHGSGVVVTESRVSMDEAGGGAGKYWLEFRSISSSATGVADGELSMKIYQEDGVTLFAERIHTGLVITPLEPGSVRWSHASGSSAGIKDKMFEPQALFTDDPLAWIGPMGSSVPLNTPSLSLVSSIPASSASASDSEAVVSWTPVPNASSYDAYTASHSSTDYVLKQAGVTSPYTFDNMPAGAVRLAIRAKA